LKRFSFDDRACRLDVAVFGILFLSEVDKREKYARFARKAWLLICYELQRDFE
jgi:hypothetical protein